MNETSQISAIHGVLHRRHAWICLFLVFFLLHNPFLASTCEPRGLEVCHPASHRATVGASELQHYTPATGWNSLDALDIVGVEVPQSPPLLKSEVLVAVPTTPRSSQQFLGPGLWFRPPPAR